MQRAILDELLHDRARKRPVVLMTHLVSGAETLIHPDETPDDRSGLLEAARAALRSDRPRVIDTPSGAVFLNIFNPPLRMIVVGAVHIAQPLIPMAGLAGYDVTVVDPRRAFASAERFPGVALDHAWPDEALERLAPDARTAVVTLTHDPKLDDPALQRALRSDAFYIGALGSRRTHARRLDRLREAGFTDKDFARIHGPVGLDIAARSPAEIAVSIMAEVTKTLREAA